MMRGVTVYLHMILHIIDALVHRRRSRCPPHTAGREHPRSCSRITVHSARAPVHISPGIAQVGAGQQHTGRRAVDSSGHTHTARAAAAYTASEPCTSRSAAARARRNSGAAASALGEEASHGAREIREWCVERKRRGSNLRASAYSHRWSFKVPAATPAADAPCTESAAFCTWQGVGRAEEGVKRADANRGRHHHDATLRRDRHHLRLLWRVRLLRFAFWRLVAISSASKVHLI